MEKKLGRGDRIEISGASQEASNSPVQIRWWTLTVKVEVEANVLWK